LSDIEPFFFKRAVIYADVGANDGGTFEAVLASGLSIDRAVLIEANPKIFARLQETVAARNQKAKFSCLNLAMSDKRSVVRLRDMEDMSRIVPGTEETSQEADSGALADRHFAVEAGRFDDLADMFPDGHVSILKIDVEGHEREVLRGCEAMLAAHAIDVLYIEAGVSADNPQQTYFRDIDDIVLGHGYRLFRIYEQTHEWIEDSPVLRRFNVAYLSPAIVARYPMTVTRELSRLRKQLEASEKTIATLTADRDTARAELEQLSASLKERFEEIAFLTRSVETLMEERDAARAAGRTAPVVAKSSPVAAKKPAMTNGERRNIRLVIVGALLYTLAMVVVLAVIFW
jgi:FkbM family methyltransferase